MKEVGPEEGAAWKNDEAEPPCSFFGAVIDFLHAAQNEQDSKEEAKGEVDAKDG